VGYITYDQLNTVLPPEQVSSEQIEDVMSMLSEMGINVIEEDEAEDDGEQKGSTEVVETSSSREVAVATTETEKLDRTDDPVRMYLREMGSVELLSREGEIAIAKRIEAGRNTMIAGLCESPLTFQAITIWRDELLDEDILLRDVIDLDATFGAHGRGRRRTRRGARRQFQRRTGQEGRRPSPSLTPTATPSPTTTTRTRTIRPT
jgi:RNA polymerase primary sigma factor